MFDSLYNLSLLIILAPLTGALLAGLFGKRIGRVGAHTVTIAGVAIACALSLLVLKRMLWDGLPNFEATLYQWGMGSDVHFQVGVLIDRLTALMMCVVTFVSLMVHIYTIGYMQDDPGYQRFFSYIALFTFAMLMLVMSNNFLQLFFGWEAVGVVSYLLIGFWFKRPTAIFANLKAFLVNRVGDFGFLIGIAAIFMYTGSLDYQTVFNKAPSLTQTTLALFANHPWSVLTIACIGLFIGAMGKSAQVPLHVWLPDSMEGPTPISALIHAATMVTAGVFMVARMSPLFEYSEVARSFVLVIGATTCFFMGLLGIVQNDIKRVIAYSTLSQLGYMVAALGASAYAAGIFHLMTHAFFKALLFLGAGSVIIGMHHEQDIRKMGGLWRYMPITYITFWIGSLALAGIPPFSGFYSKDAIIEAVGQSHIPGATFAHWAVMASVFVTALYSFRLLFLVFHTKPRMDHHTQEHLHESPWVVWLPLVLLAIPSMVIGALTVSALLYQTPSYFGKAIFVLPQNNPLIEMARGFNGPWEAAIGSFTHLVGPLGLALAGFVTAFICYVWCPAIPAWISRRFAIIHRILLEKYGFDKFNETILAAGTRAVGGLFWKVGDIGLIDGALVNGSAYSIGRFGRALRVMQSGYLYHYAFAMILGLLALLSALLWFQ